MLDPTSALVVAEPYFCACKVEFGNWEQRRFGQRLSKRVRLECAPWRELVEQHGFGVRNYAATSESGDLVVICPELVELPPETVAAILAHEFGHVLDYLHPGRHLLVEQELVIYPDDPLEQGQDGGRARVARVRQWRARDEDCCERTADAIATEVTGREIYYSGPCLLQSFDRGCARPQGLR